MKKLKEKIIEARKHRLPVSVLNADCGLQTWEKCRLKTGGKIQPSDYKVCGSRFTLTA